FSGTLDAWSPEGAVEIETDENRNLQAVLGSGAAGISQQLHDPADATQDLPAGTYSAWASVQIDPTDTRDVTVSATGDGVVPTAHQAGEDGSATTAVDSSMAVNATASDDKHGQYFQRVRVTFTTDGSPVTLAVTAGAGENAVRVDDARVVPFVAPEDADATEETVLFEDFENVDTGYWPFVTGTAELGGDARTQLAELHAPYSQAGWYGPNADGDVVEGGKLLDNVLDGDWSLMAHEENEGLILRTTTGSLPLEAGHRYRVSFDHQTSFDGSYSLIVGGDSLAADGEEPGTTVLEREAIPEARGTDARFAHEFTAGACDATWIGIENTGSGPQNDLVLDTLRVEDLGEADGAAAAPECTEVEETPAE
ncbi:MAG: hypothetical protein ACTIMA_13790, partial [Brachybacterium tyrofermentans]